MHDYSRALCAVCNERIDRIVTYLPPHATLRRLFGLLLAATLLLALIGCQDGVSGAGDSVRGDGDLGDDEAPADGDHPLSCLRDEECAPGMACDPLRFECRETECTTDADCPPDEALVCLESGLCVPAACVSATDCPETHYCRGGNCARIPDCSQIADLAISPVTPYLRSGGTRELSAYVTDLSGRVVLTDAEIRWSSLNPDVVGVQAYPEDSARAQARGGDVFGTTTILATLSFGTEACRDREFTATVSLQNFPTHEHGLRVLVSDGSGDSLIGGATVMVNGQTAVTPSDADRGVVVFDGVEPPFDIHIFHPDYHYLSLIQVNSHDVLAPLKRFYGLNKSAGVSLELDYSPIPPIRHADTRFGLGGLAYTRSLLDLHIGSLFSQPIVRGLLDHESLPLPSNVSLDFEGATAPSPQLLAVGDPDSTVAWGLGGYLFSDDMLELVTARLHSGWSDVGAFLLTSLAFTGSYYLGITTDLALSAGPMVPDNGENLREPLNGPDLNGNGRVDDYIPNYDGFVTLDAPLPLSQSLNQQVLVRTGMLPVYGSKRTDGVFALVGKRQDGRQFVPLGIGMRHVVADGTGDKPSVGRGGELRVAYAPLNGSDLRNDQYVVIAFATPFSGVFAREEARQSVSAILHRSSVSMQTVEMGDFLPFVPWAYVFEAERRVQFIPVEGGNLHRIGFRSEGREWEILVGVGENASGMTDVVLPTPPGHDPFGLELAVTAVSFWRTDAARGEEGEPQVSTSLDDLAEFNAKSLNWLDRYVKRFSLYHFDQRK